ncbi:MAG TPA: helicase-related protein, partial [Candidatus Rifleibacterium sp.]|nr:helicase-related protein [Candidatus Rifleibacterium sp.]
AGKGFLYPVDVQWRTIPGGRDQFTAAAEAIAEILANSETKEEYLVFLPGAGEIKTVQQALEGKSAAARHRILALHGSMSIEDQEAALQPSDVPRIILSTNIAETSLTIDGITT